MDSAELRRLIEQEKDPTLRQKLLAEFAAFEQHKKQGASPNYDLWEQEARTLIEERIDDPKIKAAIWHHHGRVAKQSLDAPDAQDEQQIPEASSLNHSQKIKRHYKILLLTLTVLGFVFIANYLGSR